MLKNVLSVALAALAVHGLLAGGLNRRRQRTTRAVHLAVAAGPAGAKSSCGQSDDGGQDRPRPPPLLRHPSLGQRHVCLRLVPPAGARLHRRARSRDWVHRRRARAQRHVARERRLQRVAWMGRSDVALARGADGGADVQRTSGRARLERARGRSYGEVRLAGGGSDRLSRGVSRRACRPSRSPTSSRRSRRSSERSCPATRRWIAISIATTKAGCPRQRCAG